MSSRDTLERERQADYGAPEVCLDAIADAWKGILKQRIEAGYGNAIHLIDRRTVALMMVAMKVIRASYSAKKDTFDDAHVYLDFAERFAK